jgi:SNF2 family DNA or RNA helicase
MYLDREHQHWIMEYRDDVRALFPHATNFMWNGKHVIAVPHGIDETMLLRNLNIDGVPAPIAEHYDWTGFEKPFEVQVKTCELMTMNRRCYVLNKMGTGKTKAALWSFDYLKSVGQARKMLVVAPLSTLDFTWARECKDTVPHLRVQVLTGRRDRRVKRLSTDADIYLLNHDGPGVLLQELRKRQDIDVICIDEAAFFRNRRGKPSIDMKWVTLGRKWVWAMTGSPCPNSPTDAYGLLHLITPERAPASFRQFRWETMVQISQFKWVPKAGHQEIVAAYLQPSVAYKLDAVVELPEIIEREIDVGMGPVQQQKYAELQQHALTQLSRGQVTAQNGGVLYVKLVQAACGWVYDDNHNVNELDPIQRLETIKDIIEAKTDIDDPGKTLVFVPYIHMLEGVSRFLTKSKLDHFVVSGATSLGKRNEIFEKFQHGSGRETLLAHPACMSHGLTLTAADTIIWASSIPSLEIFEQANARITRVGQRNKQQILMLCGSKTERETFRRLRMKRAVQDDILQLLSEALT